MASNISVCPSTTLVNSAGAHKAVGKLKPTPGACEAGMNECVEQHILAHIGPKSVQEVNRTEGCRNELERKRYQKKCEHHADSAPGQQTLISHCVCSNIEMIQI